MKFQVIVHDVQQADVLRGMMDALRVKGELRQVLVVETDSQLVKDLAIALDQANSSQLSAPQGSGQAVSSQPEEEALPLAGAEGEPKKPRRKRRTALEMLNDQLSKGFVKGTAGGAGDTMSASSVRSVEGE